MKVKIKAEYFKDSDYYSNQDCALARALKELGYNNCHVGDTYASLDNESRELSIDNWGEIIDNYELEEPKDIIVTLLD